MGLDVRGWVYLKWKYPKVKCMKKRVMTDTQVYALYQLLKTVFWGFQIVSWTQYLALIHELTVGDLLGAKIGARSDV